MDDDRPPLGAGGHPEASGTDAPGIPPDATSRMRRARRRDAWRLGAAVGAIAVVLLLLFAATYTATAPRTLAERTFSPSDGGRIAIRIVERGDRITGQIGVSGAGPNATALMAIDFAPIAGPSRRARIDYDEETSTVRMQVEDAVAAVEVIRQGGGIAFNPVSQPLPQPTAAGP